MDEESIEAEKDELPNNSTRVETPSVRDTFGVSHLTSHKGGDPKGVSNRRDVEGSLTGLRPSLLGGFPPQAKLASENTPNSSGSFATFGVRLGPRSSTSLRKVGRKGVNKVFVAIGVTTFCAGFIVIIVIFSLIYIDYHKNTTLNSTNNNNKSNNTVGNSTYGNRAKITGYHDTITNNKNITFYEFKTNTSSISFTETVKCDVLIAGGGGGVAWGGGGLSGGAGTGGGGGGGVGEGRLTFYKDEIYHIVVGKGGSAGHNRLGTNGKDSTIQGKNIDEIAFGGGAGGYYNIIGQLGGSSGGNYGFTGLLRDPVIDYTFVFSNMIPNLALRGSGVLTYHGNQGGYGLNNTNLNSGSGGGGAGGKGESIHKDGSGGNGGDGYLWKKNNKYYGGGGGGGGCSNCNGGKGGLGSGGDGSNHGIGATNPVPFSGGGGGGGATSGSGFGTKGAGGSIIIGNCSIIMLSQGY